ncbi:Secretory carrier-associated membrane protein 4 [Camellia lanceoleosa]|uniref:Secretory carrier-associated membrane protein 4 n=1 Tax=Camellia lanceoleosa TaxID=1840588 RepID=A0ACC0F2G5_9ERIC|nr:Secretory carrier-associated membrane protein 4 [Camellia lanceoleosa]
MNVSFCNLDLHYLLGMEIKVPLSKKLVGCKGCRIFEGIVLCLVFNVIAVIVCWIRGGGQKFFGEMQNMVQELKNLVF